MSTFQIPNRNKQVRQLSRYDTAGEIVESFNLNLSEKLGKIKSARKLVKILDEDDTNDDIINVLTVFNGRYLILTDENSYQCTIGTAIDPTNPANWSSLPALTTAGVGFESDAVTFDSKLIISTDTDMASWNGSITDDDWWTDTISGSALTANFPHMLHVHRGGQETLFVTDKNLIRYYNATAGHSTVTLQTDLVACCVTSGVSAIWVGTYTSNLDNAYVYELYVGEQLDSTPVARNAYPIDGRAVLAIETIDNVPYIFTDRGNIQYFTGAGFKTIASLPSSGGRELFFGVVAGLVQSASDIRPVHPKGMKRHNHSLYININTRTENDRYPDNTPSGIWEFDAETGQLTHKYAYADDSSYAGTSLLTRVGHLLIPNNDFTMVLAVAMTSQGQKSALFGNSNDNPQAHFVTIEIESDTVQDAYESIYQKAKTLANDERIELKFRTTKQDKVFANCSYLNASTINTTDTVTGVEVGDEVTDTYTGLIAHITDINTSDTVTSFTLDRDLGTAGDTHLMEFQNFKKNDENYTATDGELRRDGDFGVNPWIQFKVVMYGDVEYRQFLAKSNSKNET